MKEIFDGYPRITLSEETRATRNFKQFERNYRRFFRQDKQAHLIDIGGDGNINPAILHPVF